MSNMSYCRFVNTLRDMKDCYFNMDDENLSGTEKIKRSLMIQLCRDIAEEYGHELDEDYEEDENYVFQNPESAPTLSDLENGGMNEELSTPPNG